MENLLLWGFYIMTFYAFLPGFISRTFGFRVFKKGQVEKEIALTFDDGPDPRYTPELLDLLARYNAKATFFVVGSHAEGNEELLRRMKAEGHSIGIHNYVHKSNWLLRPKAVKRQIEMTNDVIERATGEKSIYYRPPWGIINLFDYSNLGYLQIILWSAMFGDWRIRLGAERLKKRMLKKLRPGEVLLLHDCGKTFGADEDAPRNMLVALEAYLQEAERRGYSFVNVEEMIQLTDQNKPLKQTVFKRGLIAAWLLWEKVFHVVYGLKPIGSGPVPTYHYGIKTYSGETVQFADGSSVSKGEKVVEIHFDNRNLSNIAATSKSPLATGIRILRDFQQALPQLALQLVEDPKAAEIKAVYGVTMIHRGAEGLGFQVYKIPKGLFASTSRVYLRILVKALTNSKQYRGTRKQKVSKDRGALDPRILLMSMQTMQERYAPEGVVLQGAEAARIVDDAERTIASASVAEDPASGLGSNTSAM